MPVVFNQNNRVLPPNARAADVARATLQVVLPIQARKYDAAFQVNGYSGIIYSYLTAGLQCACQSKRSAITTRLNEEGKASPGLINEMLTANPDFGVRPYAQKTRVTPAYEATLHDGKSSFLEVSLGNDLPAPVPLATLFDDDDLDASNRNFGGFLSRTDQNSGDINANVTLEVDPETEASSLMSSFDESILGHSDVACPVCYGSGYVGGFEIYGGFRKVFNFQHPGVTLPAEAVINVHEEIPSIQSSIVSWREVFPVGVCGVDAFRLWDVDRQVYGFTTYIDEVLISAEAQLRLYCDGKPHTIKLVFQTETKFTHLELQLVQTDMLANFELPKLTKSSNMNLRDATDAFTVNLSPRVPYIKALDVIVESTFGKALQVKSVTGWNDRKFTTLGWDVEVRPTQPQELFSLLPRRRLKATMNKKSSVNVDNSSPNAGISGGYTRT